MEFALPADYLNDLPWFVLLCATVKVAVLLGIRAYRISLSFISLTDVLRIGMAVTAGSGLMVTVFLILRSGGLLFKGFPLSALLIDWPICISLMIAWRFSKRAASLTRGTRARGEPVVIVGAGQAADQVIRSMLNDPRSPYRPLVLLDDDPSKLHTTLHGIPVAGAIDALPDTLKKYPKAAVVIAIPTAPARVVRRAYELARAGGAKTVLVLPDSKEIFRKEVSLRDLRNIELSDLLKRDEIRLELDKLTPFYKGRVILVTGAAGSIGSEICRQICRTGPQKVILMDREETGLFYLQQELHAAFPEITLVPSLTDVRERAMVDEVLVEHRPSIVFHAAAYKHVPVLESNARQALSNNVGGTLVVAQACIHTGVEKFVFISTDKAVEPVSLMGKTKRIGELMMHHLNKCGGTRFLSVRFGNVLGSRGSVIEIFRDQIRRGADLTVTDPQMKRYFMLISEAVLLVLHAAILGRGGEIFVLDMGEPVPITELATQMIRLAGLEPGKDISFVYTGLRPGERLEERLHSSTEELVPTEHPRLLLARSAHDSAAADPVQVLSRVETAAFSRNGVPADQEIEALLRLLEER